jgi:hypothetical protein
VVRGVFPSNDIMNATLMKQNEAAEPRIAESTVVALPQPSVGEQAALAFLVSGAVIGLAQALGVVAKLNGVWPAMIGWLTGMFS